MNKFFVVINDVTEDSWSTSIWRDIENVAKIFLNNNMLNNRLLKKLKKLHFSNKINRLFWIPFKGLWNRSFCIQYHDLNANNRNYIIFQSNVKFSPTYIDVLKNKKNVCIVLYLPDTVAELGIAKNINEFKRYCNYYKIDMVFSFDPSDCIKYNLVFFDIYSSMKENNMDWVGKQNSLFYVGNCRNKKRLELLIKMYQVLSEKVRCDFNLVGVHIKDMAYKDKISYNKPLAYSEIVKKIQMSNCILELVNEYQTGNTLRFKEAVCYNKKILTNNRNIISNSYYNSKFVRVFDDIFEIDYKWLNMIEEVDYKYKGDFSPMHLLKLICITDRKGR